VTKKNPPAEIPAEFRPVDCWIQARRWTRAYKRLMKTWPGRVHLTNCWKCKLSCAIAESSQQELVKAAERGQRYEVICDVCFEADLGADTPVGTTEGQAAEISRISRILDANERTN
jgi:hypothetical protein